MQHRFLPFRRFVFLTPLFLAVTVVPPLVLPWFLDSYEVHKATFTIVAAMLAGMLFLAKAMREKSLTLSWSWGTFALLCFFLFTIFSACFSVSPAMSWLGMGGADYASVLFIGSCVLFAFLLAQHAEQLHIFLRGVRFVWGIEMLIGIVLLILISVGAFSFSPSLSLATPHALAFFLGVVAFLFIGAFEGSPRPFVLLVNVVFLLALFIVAFLLDAWVLWLPLFLSGVVLLSLTLARTQGVPSFSRILPSALLVVLSLVGWFLPHLFQGFFPVEVAPSFSLSTSILRDVWGSGFDFLAGSGPGTYGISYALYALPAVNATAFWDVIFDRGFSYILTIATTGGIFVVLSFIAVQVAGIVLGFQAWAHAAKQDRGTVLGFYLAFFFLSVSTWTYGWNTTLLFVYFVLFGLLLGLAPQKKRTWTFVSSAQASVAASFGFVASLVVLSLVFFVTGARYAAEIAYAQAVALQQQNAPADEVLAKVTQAASFNRWDDVYYRELSLLLLQQINDLVRNQASSEEIQAVLSSAVNAAVRATEIGPNVVRNWEVRGNVYREVAPAVANASDFSIASFTTASRLAPNNPSYLVGLGRAYLTKADLLAQIAQSEDEAMQAEANAAKVEVLAAGEAALLRAIALKADYTPARYFLSAVYEREDKLTDAVKSMEVVRALNVNDVGVGMQLALLYLQQGKNDLARVELERIIAISPTYANAHWYLSVLLEQAGDIEGAIAQVEQVAITNPDNEAVMQRLERLQSGEVEDDIAEIPEPLEEEADLTGGQVGGDVEGGVLEGEIVSDGSGVVTP
jgi:tetratricopeptide (TPR) repeat protein